MNVTQEAARVDLSTLVRDSLWYLPMSGLDLDSLVRDPPWYLPMYWTPAPLPPCSPQVMEWVLAGLCQLGPHCVPERR